MVLIFDKYSKLLQREILRLFPKIDFNPLGRRDAALKINTFIRATDRIIKLIRTRYSNQSPALCAPRARTEWLKAYSAAKQPCARPVRKHLVRWKICLTLLGLARRCLACRAQRGPLGVLPNYSVRLLGPGVRPCGREVAALRGTLVNAHLKNLSRIFLWDCLFGQLYARELLCKVSRSKNEIK